MYCALCASWSPWSALCSALLVDRELVVVGAFREFLVSAVIRLHLPPVNSLFQRFINLERCVIHALVDIWRRDLVVVRVQRELVVRGIRVSVPFEFQVLPAHSGPCLRTH